MSDKPIRILVVDDNPATRYATSHVLRSVGWQVTEAATGEEALSKTNTEVDLVVLDVNLPDISGFEVCRQIRLRAEIKRLPVIHLSATFVKDADRAYGLELGADGYLTHPVEPPVLLATVRAFLRARKAEIEREQLLASERAARAEAERANRFKDEFLATLSHELRTPLQAMIGWSHLLKLGTLSKEEMAQGLEIIERNAQAQSQLIADLLDVSRISSGKLRLDIQPVDLPALIETSLAASLPAAEAKDIKLIRTMDPTVGVIAGDSARLQQVIWNIVNNAVKFTPQGGEVRVSLGRIGAHVEISIADNGQGIEKSLLPMIFERFRQADSSSSRNHGGLGLGLAIAKQLVELHGGSIRAESDGLGAGTCFTVSLPVSTAGRNDSSQTPAFAAESKPAALAKGIRLNDVRVLVVDDDNDSRLMLAQLLMRSGATVSDAASAAEAIASIPDFAPDVLVSDLGMPRQDGYELIKAIRGRGYSFQSLPAIALTAFVRPEDRQRALLAGFQVHIAKPVDPSEFLAAIATLVGRTGS